MQNDYQSSDLALSSATSHTEANAAATTHTAEASAHGEEKQDVFSELFGELGDHAGFYFGPYHVADLPVILIDNGLHFYTTPQEMLKAGVYTMKEHGTIVRTSDGDSPQLDMSLTNLVVFQWISMALLLFIFAKVGRKYKKEPTKAPSGLQNAIEVVFMFIRNDIVRPNIPVRSAADKLLPYFVALFFFILAMNLIGLIPGGHTATGAVPTTAALAIIAFFVINITAISVSGIGAWFKHLLGGAPWYFAPIMVPIEIVGMFIKPFALTIRLFANMTAGHVVILALLGLLFFFKNILLSPAITGFSLFLYALELLVCFIQAYIFTMLTSIFVGLAIGDHAHEAHGEHGAH